MFLADVIGTVGHLPSPTWTACPTTCRAFHELTSHMPKILLSKPTP